MHGKHEFDMKSTIKSTIDKVNELRFEAIRKDLADTSNHRDMLSAEHAKLTYKLLEMNAIKTQAQIAAAEAAALRAVLAETLLTIAAIATEKKDSVIISRCLAAIRSAEAAVSDYHDDRED